MFDKSRKIEMGYYNANLRNSGIVQAFNNSPWLTTKEASKRLRISRETLRKKEKSGEIKSGGSSRKKLWHVDDLDSSMRKPDGRIPN